MEQFKISSKVLAAAAMPDFCPRCFWIKLKASKLPWQIFPGIFNSIDAYTKKCVHVAIQSMIQHPLRSSWLRSMGDIRGFEKVPTKKVYEDTKNNIVLTGVPDDILVCLVDKVIPDYKTAKYTDTQDKLFPMYEAQVNGYALIHDPKARLFIVYMEPKTDEEEARIRSVGNAFNLCFVPTVVPVRNDKAIVDRLFSVAREIFEMNNIPAARQGCKDCEALNEIKLFL